jgi:hypothetical protein
MPHIEPKPERGIVAAACQIDGLTFSMPAPARHADVLWSMDLLGVKCGRETQGFLDHRGVFMGRKAAMVIAHVFGQLAKGEFLKDESLYSEHLW